MSPNEFQLRSALRDGEGAGVNPDTVIARARGMEQARHDRRVRYASMAAAVAVVGGIGVLGSVALSGGSGGQHSGGANKGAAASNAYDGAGGGQVASRNSAAGAPPGVPASGPVANAAAVPCPATPPRLALPGGGGSGQFGARGSLFAEPVESVKVCFYVATTSSASTVLIGDTASGLVKSLEDSAKTINTSIKCPGLPAPTERGTLVIIGVTKDRAQLEPVVATLNCPSRVTNGTALRFNWTPPSNIVQLINDGINSNPANSPISLPPPGKVTGSPVQS
ncbi:MAG: hypothetical protein ABI808_10885 [Pseudonocardiales bacterium]